MTLASFYSFFFFYTVKKFISYVLFFYIDIQTWERNDTRGGSEINEACS